MDIDRNDEHEKDINIQKAPSLENEKEKTSKEPHFTEVENAHASGLGSMGRSDEKVKEKEQGSGRNDVVY